MRTTLKCISPVDGSVYAERPVLSAQEASLVVERARNAQKAWAATPLNERIKLVRAGVARLGEMTDEVVPELAWMMGRPIRYGGEFGGTDERASYMADIAEETLKPIIVEESDAFQSPASTNGTGKINKAETAACDQIFRRLMIEKHIGE